MKKSARRAIRAMVEECSRIPEDGWPAVIAREWLVASEALTAYINANGGIRKCALEAGGDAALVDKFVARIDAMGVGPEIQR